MTKSQQKEIDIANKKGIDTTLFNNPHFNAKQMHEIRMGIEEGLDARLYARPEYKIEKMEIYRMMLRQNQFFNTDVPVDLLLHDLNEKECCALFNLAFASNKKMSDAELATYDLHNPLDRENLKQRAINAVLEGQRQPSAHIYITR